MKGKLFLLIFSNIIFTNFGITQNWVDTIYNIQTFKDIPYGNATDFAGNSRTLHMDISHPLGDSISECGRPLLVAVHGGAFIAGNKNDGMIKRMREDFAKRGFTTASVSYRLGQFQTHQQIHCNVSNLGFEWDCLNMADTLEWYRAYFRGVQDVNGAIRYLVNHADEYDIDPQNIFVVGVSAGGFIAMGVGFMDDEMEVLKTQTEANLEVQAPIDIYEAPCIQTYGLDTSIASMNFARPDLGSFAGSLNLPANPSYQIKGIGNFYGGVFNNIFVTQNEEPPALYLFHQPNDLIVPYNYNRVFAGYASC